MTTASTPTTTGAIGTAAKQGRVPTAGTAIASATPAAAPMVATADGRSSPVPVPAQNPLAYAEAAPAPAVDESKKPFWKFWSKD